MRVESVPTDLQTQAFAGSVSISSLLAVMRCESPAALQEDWLARWVAMPAWEWAHCFVPRWRMSRFVLGAAHAVAACAGTGIRSSFRCDSASRHDAVREDRAVTFRPMRLGATWVGMSRAGGWLTMEVVQATRRGWVT